jgi:hypothetical protein
VFDRELTTPDLELVAAFCGTFAAVDRFVVVWFHGGAVVTEADWVQLFEENVEVAGLSVFHKLALIDWLVASHLYQSILM